MSVPHLLDVLAGRRGCLISDLALSPLIHRSALWDLFGMEGQDYPLSQWQDTVRYLTGYEHDFESVEEIKDFLRKEMEVQKNATSEF